MPGAAGAPAAPAAQGAPAAPAGYGAPPAHGAPAGFGAPGGYGVAGAAGGRGDGPDDSGVEANARLTGATAVILLILFAMEGATLVLGIRDHLGLHAFIGAMLIPPVLLKIGSTGWRFARYYAGSPAYRRKGPPPALLRLLGPILMLLTGLLLASGTALLLAPDALGGHLRQAHQASFILWFIAMSVHVLGHIAETARLAPRDLARRSRSQVAGASARQWIVAASLIAGAVLGSVLFPHASSYLLHNGGFFQHGG